MLILEEAIHQEMKVTISSRIRVRYISHLEICSKTCKTIIVTVIIINRLIHSSNPSTRLRLATENNLNNTTTPPNKTNITT
jgi:hypothetical protein